jgi:hypothetical protein
MERNRAVAKRRGLAAGVALLVAVAAQPSGGTVTIGATSASVASPGEFGRICVVLHTGGDDVAGTQNDLRWDGRCATLPDKSNCQVAGSHGKTLQHAINPQGSDFSYRALLLSFGDTDPMPDGPLYCCNFQGEADPGQCCTIALTNVAASDPEGTALAAVPGPAARLCTAPGSNQAGRSTGSMRGGGQPLSASNEPAGGGAGPAANEPPPPAAAPAGGGGGPIGQVLPGGGTRVESLPEPGAAPPTPALEPSNQVAPAAPAAPAAPPATAAAGVTAPPVAPATAVPTSAATEAATAVPTTPDTPAAKATAQPTAVPTLPAVPKGEQAKPAAPAAPAAQSSGWFGCQIAAGASAGPVLMLGLLALVGAGWPRRRARRHRHGSKTQ